MRLGIPVRRGYTRRRMPQTAQYRTAPVASKELPKGIPYIVSNEMAERFSFYGMRTILVVFMTQYLMNRSGELSVMREEEAKGYYHLFTSAAYFFPVLGALLSDGLLGKYRTIIALSFVYCAGHAALALDDTRLGLALGLALVAIGAGGIKPCVSAHVGDQFGVLNQHLIPRTFAWFYFAINLGSSVSTYLTPELLERYGPAPAFALPGVMMFLATIVFWSGRHRFVHIPPGGFGFVREALSGEGRQALARLCGIYVFVAVFWSLYDQTGSAWVLQAEHLDRHWLGIEWLPAQIQVMNPLLILVFIVLFNYGIYPALGRFVTLTPLRKISAGLFLMALSFCIPAWLESRIAAGETPSMGWQVLAYVLLTASEILVSITGLEFSYTQAPRKMKSIVMALFFLSISAGNLFTAAVNFFIQNDDGTSKLAGASYYWFFVVLMLAASVLFVGVAKIYRGRTYIQGEGAA